MFLNLRSGTGIEILRSNLSKGRFWCAKDVSTGKRVLAAEFTLVNYPDPHPCESWAQAYSHLLLSEHIIVPEYARFCIGSNPKPHSYAIANVASCGGFDEIQQLREQVADLRSRLDRLTRTLESLSPSPAAARKPN
jgi:hypothetical protein